MTLSDLSIRRPVFSWMLMLGLIIFGIICMFRLGVARLPNVDFPFVNIRLTWEGASPEVMESDVVDVVEEAMTSIQGIREITSSVRQGQANVTIELELDKNIDVVVQDVQTRLSQAQRQLPRDLDPPVVTKTNPEDQPILWIAVRGSVPLRFMMDYVQNYLEDRFATISGVGEVFLGGFLERNLRVWIDAKKLDLYQLTVLDVINAIQQGHSEVPAGRIETPTTEMNVRSMGEAINTEEFGNIVIPLRGGQPVYKPIYLKDVATIEDGLADLRRISRFNGEPAVGLGIRKQRGVNEVQVAARVLKRLEEIKKEIPPGIHVDLSVDRTKFTRAAVQELGFTMGLSALVTSLVCWIFLGSISATLNVLIAIPTSILGAFIVMYFLGFTLNTFTMMGLSLAIGIVVDDAIMVLENIVRHREMGLPRLEAARVGANQIAFAAMATTLSVIAIFLPVTMMSGVIGKFFYEFGITLSIAVAISLLEALTLTPMRCSQFLSMGQRQTSFGQFVERTFKRLSISYHDRLAWVLNHRVLILLASFAIFVGSLFLWKTLAKEFIPPQDQSMFLVRLQTPPGSSIEFTDEKFKQAEKFILSRPEVNGYFCFIGGFGGGEVNSGQIFITLKESGKRPVQPPYQKPPTQKDVMNYFRKELSKIPQIKAAIQDLSQSGLSAQRGFPVEMTILGPDWDQLIEYSQEIVRRMQQTDLLADVDTNYESGVSEVRVIPDRAKASERGVSIDAIGQTINALIAGERVARYTQGGRRYDVRIRLVPEERTAAENINDLWVWNNHGELVQLRDVMTLTQKQTVQSITRSNRERAIQVRANVASGKSQADALETTRRIVQEVLPAGYRLESGGNTKTFQESFSGLWFVLWLGILVAYMVLASQFNSFKDPLTILLALPFSITGALLALKIANQSINIYSFIGIVLLMGIVKKNSILLVEFTNQIKEQGKSVKESLLVACPIRLRPILMTSLATVAAAIPPALAWGPGSEVLIPMAAAVIGGVIVSTFFTLFIIPCVYSLISLR